MSSEPVQPLSVSKPPRKRRRKIFWLSVLLVFLVLLGVRITLAFTSFRGIPIGYARWKTRMNFEAEGYYDYRGSVHVHSHLSADSKGTFEEIAEAARRVDLDFIIMADHISPQSVPHGVEQTRTLNETGKSPLFIIGAEVGTMGDAILAFPLEQDVHGRQHGAAAAADGARQQNALAFVSHAERFHSWETTKFDGIELYNMHADFLDENKKKFGLRAAFLPPGALLKSIVQAPEKNTRRWDELLAQRRVPIVGSSDSHASPWLLPFVGGAVGAYERFFKVVTTHVLVKEKELTTENVVEALRAGRSYVAMDIWRDGTGFSFTATDGEQRWTMGDEVPWSESLTFTVHQWRHAMMMIYKDGKLAASHAAKSTQYKPPGPGVYRVEVFLADKLWIISNPIYVR